MFIEPMQKIGGIQGSDSFWNTSGTREASGVDTFRGIFENAINEVKDDEQAYAQVQYLTATGQIDDTHTLPMYAAKLQLSTDLLIQLRTKALDAYNELIRINV